MVLAFWGMAVASGIHAGEEYIYPGGFLRWMRSVFPHSAPSVGGAIVINGAFFALVLSPLISNPESAPIFNMSIASLLLANGALHVAGTFLTRRYSPGAITSVLCYFPAAIFTLITIPPKWHMGTEPIVWSILLGIFRQLIPLAFMIRPTGRAHSAWGGHFVTRVHLRLALRLVGNRVSDCDHREQGPQALYASRSDRCPRRACW
jgi:hypothetical protein